MLIEKLPIFLVNTLLLFRFHKHSFTPYPSLSGQVGISSIPSKNADSKLPIFVVNTLLLFCSHNHSFTAYPSFSPYSRTDRITDGGMNTLAARGLEELFFQLCCCVSFLLLWREIVLGVTYLPYQLCHCAWLHRSVFWLCPEKVLGVTYLPSIPVVPLRQFLVAAGNSFWLHSF
jgi:hypothetical protein